MLLCIERRQSDQQLTYQHGMIRDLASCLPAGPAIERLLGQTYCSSDAVGGQESTKLTISVGPRDGVLTPYSLSLVSLLGREQL